jgi:hypothetical protein
VSCESGRRSLKTGETIEALARRDALLARIAVEGEEIPERRPQRIPRASEGRASFADEPFAGHDMVLTLLRPDEYEGNWYHGYVAGLHMECWLCPALFCYASIDQIG